MIELQANIMCLLICLQRALKPSLATRKQIPSLWGTGSGLMIWTFSSIDLISCLPSATSTDVTPDEEPEDAGPCPSPALITDGDHRECREWTQENVDWCQRSTSRLKQRKPKSCWWTACTNTHLLHQRTFREQTLTHVYLNNKLDLSDNTNALYNSF